ncbi:MAG: sugar phosphate isomerase/epimerase, partial [Ruminococcus sp.]|nr:sugar phosphate isomerase/epimerase [Ruminococcus sp.]
MKISFSTLACPEYSWNDIISTAADLSYDGIEIRGLGNDIDVWKSGPFTDKKISKTLDTLERTGLKISCFSSNICLKYRNDDAIKEEISKYIDLAVKTDTPYIRILADNAPAPDGHTPDDDYIAEVISAFATPKVTLLVETNGVYSDTRKLKNLLDKIDSPYVAALWDMHHPYRYAGESPKTTVENLGKYIKYCHIKDSILLDKDNHNSVVYKLCGEGDLPLEDCISELKKIGYDGYVTLEWVKRWTPTLENADIVFPHFAEFMSSFITERKSFAHEKSVISSEKKTKYDINPQKSITNDGTYPFPKNQLIDCTFPDMLDIICEQYPDQYAFRYCWDYEKEKVDYIRTYTEFREDVRTFARSLIAM